MELVGIMKFADALPGGSGKESPQLLRPEIDTAIKVFYWGILDVLYMRYKKTPPKPNKDKPHFVRRFSNSGFKFKIDIDKYVPFSSEQKIKVTMLDKKRNITNEIEIFRPEPDPKTGERTGGNFFVTEDTVDSNGKPMKISLGTNTKRSAEKMEEVIRRMKYKKSPLKIRNGKSRALK